MNITKIEYEVDKVRYVLVVLLVLMGLCQAISPFDEGAIVGGSGGYIPSVSIPYEENVPVPIPVEPQDIYIISRTEYTLDNNAPGVVILLSAWQSGTPNDVEVPGVNIYITGGPTDRIATTGPSGYIFVKWPFTANDVDRDWALIFSPDPNDPYAPGSASTTVCTHVPDDLNAFTELSEILNAYPGYRNKYLRELPRKP